MVVVMSIIGTISCRIHVWYECDEISWGYRAWEKMVVKKITSKKIALCSGGWALDKGER